MSDYPGMVDAIPQIRQALASLDTTLPYTCLLYTSDAADEL